MAQEELAGMAEVFDEVGMIATADVLSKRPYGNLVVYGTRASSLGESAELEGGVRVLKWTT